MAEEEPVVPGPGAVGPPAAGGGSRFEAGFKWPSSFLIAAVCMMVGCGAAAYLSMYAFARVSPQALELFATVAIAIISVILGCTGVMLLIAGGIRWAWTGVRTR